MWIKRRRRRAAGAHRAADTPGKLNAQLTVVYVKGFLWKHREFHGSAFTGETSHREGEEER